ncbi:MAG: hypothetical protein ACI9VR_002588 [Cognaticolwellia sp.]
MNIFLCFLLLFSVAFGAQVDEIPNPAATDAWLVDQAGILSGEESTRISVLAESMYRDMGVDLVLVTVPEVEGGAVKELATALFNEWRPGDPEANNGVLILFSLGDRRLEMETGYGLESLLPDGWLGTMQQQYMVPAFKEGEYGKGLVQGIEQVDARLRLNPVAARLGAPAPVYDPNPPDPYDPYAYQATEYNPWLDSELMPIYGGAGGGLILIGGATFYIRRRRRVCRAHTPAVRMELLPESEEDAHLSDGQTMEENLGAVKHDVYMCPECSAVKTFSRSLLFSGYGRCPECAHRTASTARSTLVAPSYSHGGKVQISVSCQQCGHSSTKMRSTPKKTRPSSNSSSNSSFGSSSRSSGGRSSSSSSSGGRSSSRSSSSRRGGGGRSGGGGAGSSW